MLFDDYCVWGVVINYIRDIVLNLVYRNYGVVGVFDVFVWIEDWFESRSEERKCFKKMVNMFDIDLDFFGFFLKYIRDVLIKLVSMLLKI